MAPDERLCLMPTIAMRQAGGRRTAFPVLAIVQLVSGRSPFLAELWRRFWVGAALLLSLIGCGSQSPAPSPSSSSSPSSVVTPPPQKVIAEFRLTIQGTPPHQDSFSLYFHPENTGQDEFALCDAALNLPCVGQGQILKRSFAIFRTDKPAPYRFELRQASGTVTAFALGTVDLTRDSVVTTEYKYQ
jgi:hypothetical protein